MWKDFQFNQAIGVQFIYNHLTYAMPIWATYNRDDSTKISHIIQSNKKSLMN